MRITAFGIFWFFITLSVESSIIPIPMVIDEYRVYLPSVFFFTGMVSAIFLFKKPKIIAISILVLIPLIFSYATYKRNIVWASNVSLWTNVVRKSPLKERGHTNLGNTYKRKGLTDKTIELDGKYREVAKRDNYFKSL